MFESVIYNLALTGIVVLSMIGLALFAGLWMKGTDYIVTGIVLLEEKIKRLSRNDQVIMTINWIEATIKKLKETKWHHKA